MNMASMNMKTPSTTPKRQSIFDMKSRGSSKGHKKLESMRSAQSSTTEFENENFSAFSSEQWKGDQGRGEDYFSSKRQVESKVEMIQPKSTTVMKQGSGPVRALSKFQ